MSQSVPEALAAFVRTRLPSVEQIEIVLLLRGEPSRAWSSPEVSERLGTPPESTAMRLFLLASNGIVTFEGSGVPRYRYVQGASPAIDTHLSELADLYAREPQSVHALVGSTPAPDPLRSFADAFRLKK
jgi:hypothetical protein